MTRRMGDGANELLRNIPADIDLVAYYIDGETENTGLALELFGSRARVPISTQPSSTGGIVLDGESGDYTPQQLFDGVMSRRARGMWPTGYTSESEWGSYRQPFIDARIAEPPWWIAAYPGPGPVLYPGAVAHQFDNHNNTWDESVVADYWPGVDPVPAPAPIPDLHGRKMISAHPTQQGYVLAHSDGAVEAFGAADYHGGANAGGNPAHPAPDLSPGDVIVGIAMTPSGGGYWLYALSGAVFSYGDAQYLGSWDRPLPKSG